MQQSADGRFSKSIWANTGRHDSGMGRGSSHHFSWAAASLKGARGSGAPLSLSASLDIPCSSLQLHACSSSGAGYLNVNSTFNLGQVTGLDQGCTAVIMESTLNAS